MKSIKWFLCLQRAPRCRGPIKPARQLFSRYPLTAPRKRFKACDVNTYLDAPEDVGTVFDTLPNDRIALAQSVLDATSKQVQIRTTNSS
jgi:hypothetical protein